MPLILVYRFVLNKLKLYLLPSENFQYIFLKTLGVQHDISLILLPWYQYLQIKHFIYSPQVQKSLQRPLSDFENLLKNVRTTSKGLVSDLYNILLKIRDPKIFDYQKCWQKYCNSEFTKIHWQKIWSSYAL